MSSARAKRMAKRARIPDSKAVDEVILSISQDDNKIQDIIYSFKATIEYHENQIKNLKKIKDMKYIIDQCITTHNECIKKMKVHIHNIVGKMLEINKDDDDDEDEESEEHEETDEDDLDD